MKRNLDSSSHMVARKRRTRGKLQYCNVHGKKRTMANMSLNEEGEWACISGSECQQGSNSAMCIVHRRSRTHRNLTKNEQDLWVCIPDSECQVAVVTEMEVCSVHDRHRTIANLSKNSDGHWVCNPEFQCQLGAVGTGEQQMCTVHVRMRTVQNLALNQEGEWVCIGGAQCKGDFTKSKTKKKTVKAKSKSNTNDDPDSITANLQYKNGNFRGALQEHFKKNGVLKFDKPEKQEGDGTEGSSDVFVTKCRIEENEDADGKEGVGHGSNKKNSIQFAALDLIIKLDLVTPEQHFEMHPETLK